MTWLRWREVWRLGGVTGIGWVRGGPDTSAHHLTLPRHSSIGGVDPGSMPSKAKICWPELPDAGVSHRDISGYCEDLGSSSHFPLHVGLSGSECNGEVDSDEVAGLVIPCHLEVGDLRSFSNRCSCFSPAHLDCVAGAASWGSKNESFGRGVGSRPGGYSHVNVM